MFHSRTVRSMVVVVCLLGCAQLAAAPATVRHVFLIVLENQSYAVTFGPDSRAPYLAHTLSAQGVLLQNYYGIGHSSLDNYIALISGQAPNEATQGDCSLYSEFQLSTPGLDPHGQVLGVGCIYPSIVRTLPDELEAKGLTWKGYMEDMGKDPARESSTCAHSPIGSQEQLLRATSTDQYAVKHNPFVYFHSIIDDEARCNAHVVSLDRLAEDLRRVATTPNYAFITPNLCNDGHDAPCVDHQPGGLVSMDAFLKKWVPLITGAPAFKKDGLLIITFDEADTGLSDSGFACCGEIGLTGARYPPGLHGPGGGRIGAVLISPLIKPGSVSEVAYNHYSLLRSVAGFFGVAPLGFAAEPGLPPFGPDVFNAH
ncbi:MAG TPA: alkaline phosphatase family protein [Steroidobacteraceae bacterium]